MFLKEVLAHRPATRGRHAEGIRQAEEAGG